MLQFISQKFLNRILSVRESLNVVSSLTWTKTSWKHFCQLAVILDSLNKASGKWFSVKKLIGYNSYLVDI